MTEKQQQRYEITEDELDELVMYGAVSLVTETRSRVSELVVAIRARKCKMAMTENKNSCQDCINEMLIFCKDCPHINTNITQGFGTTRYMDAEDWVHAQYASVKNCNDYRTLNKLQDDVISEIRRFETEVGRWK